MNTLYSVTQAACEAEYTALIWELVGACASAFLFLAVAVEIFRRKRS